MTGRTVFAALLALGWSISGAALAQDSATPSAVQGNDAQPVEEGLDRPQSSEPRPELIPTSAFAARSEFSNAQLSPDGRQFAISLLQDGKSLIVLFDAETRKPIQKFVVGDKVALEWFRWAGNNKILFSISVNADVFGTELRITRLALVHVSERWTEMLGSDVGGITGDDVIFVANDGAYALVSTQKSIYDYPSVFRYELDRGGAIEQVEPPRDGVWNWYADNVGTVRIGTGWRNKRLRIYYRPGPGDELKLIARLKEGDDDAKFWDVAQIVSGSDIGYVLQANDAGRVGLYKFDYSRREIVEPFYENAAWDVDSVILRDGDPLAALYTDDREQVVWFDSDYRKQHEMLSRALPDTDLWITSRSDDSSRMLVWAGSEADPGVIYVFSPGDKRLDEFAQLRPEIDFRNLVRPTAISYQARDGTGIRAYLSLPRGRAAKDLPLIIMPHGGPFWVRDTLTYNDEVQLLANRGYAVLQPNFRGSGGYGESFHNLGSGQIGRAMQDDLDDAMDWAVAQGIADPARVCVVGASYGGYAAMWAVIRNPERYRCAASWAGVTDWDKMLSYDRRFLDKKGRQQWEGLVEGDSEGDLDDVSPYRLARNLGRPLLLAHGTADSNVPFTQFKKMRDAADKAAVEPTYLVIEDEGHSFSKPENEQAWYDALEAFLAKHNPAD